jgi:hypothetical protein
MIVLIDRSKSTATTTCCCIQLIQSSLELIHFILD